MIYKIKIIKIFIFFFFCKSGHSRYLEVFFDYVTWKFNVICYITLFRYSEWANLLKFHFSKVNFYTTDLF